MREKLSKDFPLSEFTKSQVADRLGISNKPLAAHLSAAKELFKNVLQPVRDHYGPTIITSGYRSLELNAAIGGSSSSQHCEGEAADFEVLGVSNLEVAEWIRDNLVFDQLILEFYEKGDPYSGWIHGSYTTKRKNRQSTLTAYKEQGRIFYVEGIRP